MLKHLKKDFDAHSKAVDMDCFIMPTQKPRGYGGTANLFPTDGSIISCSDYIFTTSSLQTLDTWVYDPQDNTSNHKPVSTSISVRKTDI